MKLTTRILMTGFSFAVGSALFAPSFAKAQPPARGGNSGASSTAVNASIARMMRLDKNRDGKLERSEIVDERLLALFERADANKDGIVTKEELKALFESEGGHSNGGSPRGRRDDFGRTGGPPNDFGNPGGPPRDGVSRPGGPGLSGPPRPGVILPPRLQNALHLTDAQKKQLAELQKEVDARLDKILTPNQKTQMKNFRGRGPGGPGGPPHDRQGGPPPPRGDGFGPPGGPPPREEDDGPPPPPQTN